MAVKRTRKKGEPKPKKAAKKEQAAGGKTSAFGDRRKRKTLAQEPAKTKNTRGEARGAGIGRPFKT